ncbi:uncharacterized protein LOC128861126 [Anastrepha ludens]|uniref:uncharacterized protein LOC128861126 n=1 Tax=Anastrepha ludens TaxID=28586 RepID=UPI0023B109FE|nr:uncharacterized protein LOC128861126 [Anastrepha ludens]
MGYQQHLNPSDYWITSSPASSLTPVEPSRDPQFYSRFPLACVAVFLSLIQHPECPSGFFDAGAYVYIRATARGNFAAELLLVLLLPLALLWLLFPELPMDRVLNVAPTATVGIQCRHLCSSVAIQLMAEQMCSEVEQIGHLGQKDTDAMLAIPPQPTIVIDKVILFERRSKTFKVGNLMHTAMTALHWAAKHGNQDVVKLIAGTYKADVNARTNGGYTPLHVSMQFGRNDVFELLVNVYKANRDLVDWSGNKPLDYSKQSTSVSPSTFSSEYYSDFYAHEIEPYNNNWARSLLKGASGGTVRSKKYASKAYSTMTPSSKTSVSRAQSVMTATAPTSRQRPKTAMAMSLFSPEQDLSKRSEAMSPPATPLNVQLNKSNDSLTPGTPARRASDDGVSISSAGSAKSEENGVDIAMSKFAEQSAKDTPKKSTQRRKESFLRKTLRAAVAGNRNTNEHVTNPSLFWHPPSHLGKVIFYFYSNEIKAKKKAAAEKDSGFLRIGSLNVRVKKTTEAFSNFLGVGNAHTLSHTGAASRLHQRSHRHHPQGHHHHQLGGTTRNPMTKTKPLGFETLGGKSSNKSSNKKLNVSSRASVPVNMNSLTSNFENLHKTWGSADNIQHHEDNQGDKAIMPPPKNMDALVKKRLKSITTPTIRSSVTSSVVTDSPRDSISSSNSSSNLVFGYSSMPTTPSQKRAPIGRTPSDMLMDSDSDSACGFDANWAMSGRSSVSSGNLQVPQC